MKTPLRIAAFIFVFAFALAQNSRANLVTDGNFTDVTYSGTLALSGTLYGMFGSGTGSTLSVAGWSTSGYNFVYAPGTADAGTKAAGANAGVPEEAPGQYNIATGTTNGGYGSTYIWGPHNGSANGLPTSSPLGGNFIAMDGTFEVSAVTQTITGLTIGQTYALSFYWAGAQQESFTGTTSDFITASLGSQSGTTNTVSLATMGFSGWTEQTFYYTATGTSETLSFLATGSPTGEPPFSLLANVDLEVIPDVSSWMVYGGFGALCIIFEVLRRRRRRQFAFEMSREAALTA